MGFSLSGLARRVTTVVRLFVLNSDFVVRCESRLREVNFHPQLSHEEIGKFGRRASELQDKLKPLLLQLDSYNQLPAVRYVNSLPFALYRFLIHFTSKIFYSTD